MPRQRVLLHVCCGPCAAHAVERLAAEHDVTLFFSNGNIAPRAEYERRLAAARTLAARTGLTLLEDDYDHDAWRAHVAGLEDEPERGRRCRACFAFSLARTARAAAARGFDAFTTTLTISPHKDSAAIFEAGRPLGPFLAVDFKKGDGFRRSAALAREYGLYRQDYCGCEFSRRPAGPPFLTLADFLRRTCGHVLHRVPLDLGLGCPHRDARGGGGCAFCPPHGSRAPHLPAAATLEQQVALGLDLARRRYRAGHFMAYVQAFTGTLAPAGEQRRLYARLLELYPFEAVSIGTRPDCLPPDVLDVLGELRGRTDVWVELGVQTVHDATLRRVNRGHDWAASRRAIAALHARGIRVAAHAILGLPGETAAHFSATADALAAEPLCGVKIHNLHVVRDTALAAEYARRPFPLLDAPAYAEALIDFLRRLPPDVAIMRINTDTPAAELVAPRWTMGKAAFRDCVIAGMQRRGVRQGDLYRPPPGRPLPRSRPAGGCACPPSAGGRPPSSAAATG